MNRNASGESPLSRRRVARPCDFSTLVAATLRQLDKNVIFIRPRRRSIRPRTGAGALLSPDSRFKG
jgi:hypothetical protein